MGGGSLQISQRRKLIKQSSRKGAQLVIVKVPIKVKHKHKPASTHEGQPCYFTATKKVDGGGDKRGIEVKGKKGVTRFSN